MSGIAGKHSQGFLDGGDCSELLFGAALYLARTNVQGSACNTSWVAIAKNIL